MPERREGKNNPVDYFLGRSLRVQQIETSGKKIAGRYPTEAILEMKAGDTLSVNKGGCTKTETYMVVQAGNELFLVKKNR